MRFVRGTLSVVLMAALAVACAPSEKKSADGRAASRSPGKSREGKPVAWVGDEVITAEEVADRLAELAPFLQARYRESTERKKEFLNNLVRFELLAQEAYRRGLDQTPETQAIIKKHLVQELSRQAVEEALPEPTEADLRAFYEEHINEFVKPERVRLQHIFVAVGEDDRAARTQTRKKLEGLLSRIEENERRASPRSPAHGEFERNLFAELARDHSDDKSSKLSGGDLRYLTREELAERYSPQFAEAAFRLSDDARLSRVIETPQGFHIARLSNRHGAVNRPLEDLQVQETIKARISREQRTRSFDAFIDRLREQAGVRVDEEALAGIEPPMTPSPVGIPPAVPRPRPPTPPSASPNAPTPARADTPSVR